MKSRSHFKIEDSLSYISVMLIERDNHAIRSLLSKTCRALTDYGMAFGAKEVQMDLDLFHDTFKITGVQLTKKEHHDSSNVTSLQSDKLNLSVETVRTYIKHAKECFRDQVDGDFTQWFKGNGLFDYMCRYARLVA